MGNPTKDDIKLAQISSAASSKCKENSHLIVERILQRGFNLDYQIPASNLGLSTEYFGCTALHIALKEQNLDVFSILLKYGADFTIRNDKEETVVHLALGQSYHRKKKCWNLKGKLYHPFIDEVMAGHTNTNNFANPCSKSGPTHFHAACMINNVMAVKLYLSNGVDINEATDVNNSNLLLSGYTPLHFAARYSALETVELLLNQGANSNLKDAQGMTPLYLLIEYNMEIMDWIFIGKQPPCQKVMDDLKTNKKIIEIIVDKLESCNFNEKDLSRFLLACTVEDTLMIEQVLKGSANMQCAIDLDSPVWPGYTFAHFASRLSFKITKYLLEAGANFTVKDARGVTPLELCIRRYTTEEISQLISCQKTWQNITFSNGKTRLADFLYNLDNADQFEDFLRTLDSGINVFIPVDSTLWPGYTIPHLLVMFAGRAKLIESLNAHMDYNPSEDLSKETKKTYYNELKTCLKFEPDISIQDAHGSTALHLAFDLQKGYIVQLLMRHHHQVINPVNKCGLSHLHIACAANYKPLVINLLLAGADANATLTSDSSYKKVFWVDERLENPTMFDESAWNSFSFRMYLKMKLHAFNMSSGSTPLHVSVAAQSPQLVELLLKHGADINVKDVNGLTPIHRILTTEKPGDFANCLSCIDDLQDCSTEAGLSHLHVACLVSSIKGVKMLIDQGANIEANITHCALKLDSKCEKSSSYEYEFIDLYGDKSVESLSFLAPYLEYRPLHFALKSKNPEIVELLIRRGADILAKSSDGLTPLYLALKSDLCEKLFVNKLQSDRGLQERVEKETGLTMFHLYCHLLDLKRIKKMLKNNVDVNARIRDDSPVWSGCTPLHVVLLRTDFLEDVEQVVKLLLNHAADVTTTRTNGFSPVHVAYYQAYFELDERWDHIVERLIDAHDDFNINPTIRGRISHFHVACMRNSEYVVEQFLEHNVDPNFPIDYFCNSLWASTETYPDIRYSGGASPLHLAVIYESTEVISVLLNHGADLNAEDRLGETPLHLAVKYCADDDGAIIKTLIRHGADIYAENIYGETPMEMLLESDEIEDEVVKLFIKRGGRINVYNPISKEGLLAVALCRGNEDYGFVRTAFKSALTSPDVTRVDEAGRNAIHNVVSMTGSIQSPETYADAIGQLVKLGISINHKNKEGMTPLHVAAIYSNSGGAAGLLQSDVNINTLNMNGEPAFAYALLPLKLDVSTVTVFATVICMYQRLKIHVSEKNLKVYREACKVFKFNSLLNKDFHKELKHFEKWKIGSYPITLGAFLSESKAVADYPFMDEKQHKAIDKLFRSKRWKRTASSYLKSILILQYKKAKARSDLLEKARLSLIKLTNVGIPYLCWRHLFRFLSNEDLKNLDASSSLDLES